MRTALLLSLLRKAASLRKVSPPRVYRFASSAVSGRSGRDCPVLKSAVGRDLHGRVHFATSQSLMIGGRIPFEISVLASGVKSTKSTSMSSPFQEISSLPSWRLHSFRIPSSQAAARNLPSLDTATICFGSLPPVLRAAFSSPFSTSQSLTSLAKPHDASVLPSGVKVAPPVGCSSVIGNVFLTLPLARSQSRMLSSTAATVLPSGETDTHNTVSSVCSISVLVDPRATSQVFSCPPSSSAPPVTSVLPSGVKVSELIQAV